MAKKFHQLAQPFEQIDKQFNTKDQILTQDLDCIHCRQPISY